MTDIAALRALKLTELRKAWRNQFANDPPTFRSRDLLLRAFVHRLEVATFGDLSPRLKKRLTELARQFEANPDYDPAPRQAPPMGSALVRDWNGVRHLVLVTPGGFQYLDKTYASLSQVAKAITGAHWSGPRFFGLIGEGLERA